jgi:hypothetical protein
LLLSLFCWWFSIEEKGSSSFSSSAESLGFCFSFSEETLGILVSPSVYPVNFLYRKSCGIPTGGEVVPWRAGAAVEAEAEETWKGSL